MSSLAWTELYAFHGLGFATDILIAEMAVMNLFTEIKTKEEASNVMQMINVIVIKNVYCHLNIFVMEDLTVLMDFTVNIHITTNWHYYCFILYSGVDECLCNNTREKKELLNEKCFHCLNHPTIIKFGKVCDGIFHCPDLSDECICRKRGPPPELCNYVDWGQNQSPSPQWKCSTGDNSHEFITSTKICNGIVDCKDSSDETNCENNCSGSIVADGELKTCKADYQCPGSVLRGVKCDGVIDCKYALKEECRDCANKPAFCSRLRNYGDRYECNDEIRIDSNKICNGVKDCSDGEDEQNCPNRFHCNSGFPLHVFNRTVCNKQKDCEDLSDEMHCSNETHFYCNDGGEPKFIAKKQVCDGSEDCTSSLDECLDRCISSAFSNVNLMISNEHFVSFTWMISLFAVIGNLFVSSRSIRNIFFSKQQLLKHELIIKYLIFNLSLSDLLVALYTLAICIKNATITKDYCKTDRQWRSGFTCSALGTLLLIGSENSVITLTIITGFRMKTVLRPFAKETSMKMIACLLTLSWVVSIVLGLIPFFNQDFFIDSIWYDRHPLYSTINKKDVVNLSRSLLTKQRFEDDPAIEEKLGTWSLLESLISDLNSTYKVERRFGYYSTHGVCLPTLFPNPNTDTAWLYSLFILLVNFLAFIFIFIGYVKIYSEMNEST
uniref:uncharacterized protein LOC120340036 n=1 Tax=Styela clava TaxID=7725 RepID=UPI0019395B47|nr:uncharacterized protein LOC120340036 [Styela clava]